MGNRPGYYEENREAIIERSTRYYRNNREAMIAAGRDWRKTTYAINKCLAAAYRSSGCCRCKHNVPEALDSHHVEPSNKSFSISSGAKNHSPKTYIKELLKTITLCANCHREFHRKSEPEDVFRFALGLNDKE